MGNKMNCAASLESDHGINTSNLMYQVFVHRMLKFCMNLEIKECLFLFFSDG